MTTLAPKFSASIDYGRRELHFATSGLFDVAAMQALQAEIGEAIGPFLSERMTFRAFGDLTDYAVQTKDISEEMTRLLCAGEKVGIEKTAILITSTIVRMQYARISQGCSVEIFDNRSDALAWLREKR